MHCGSASKAAVQYMHWSAVSGCFKMAGEEQVRLANIVKGLHGRLRRELRQANGDHEALWTKHCSDQPRLCKYAEAMHMLAEKHWTKNSPSGRVEWCYNTAVQFFRQGGLHSSMVKQRKRIQFAGTGRLCCCCFTTENNSERCTRATYPSTKEKLLLLDVGSCFNPFSSYEDITAVAIDLQPAVESVYKCDFLRLSIEEPDSTSHSGKTPNPCLCFTKGVHDNHTQWTQMSYVHELNAGDSRAENTCKQRMASEDMDVHELNAGESRAENTCKQRMASEDMDVHELNAGESRAENTCKQRMASEDMDVHELNAGESRAQNTCKQRMASEDMDVHELNAGESRAQNTCKQRMASEDKDEHEVNAGESTSPADFTVQLSLLCNQNDLPNPTAISCSFLQPYLGGAEVTRLPSASFHVVVFSLFLSYFPSPQQRWECCVKAHKLLVMNGLLLIITPDSSHQNRNAPMMKSWKLALESIGFVRWCYVKDTHLHCMGFRKVAPCHMSNHSHDNISPVMLYIPQDNQEDEEESVFVNVPRTEKEDLEVCEFFSELPNFDD